MLYMQGHDYVKLEIPLLVPLTK